MLDIDKNSLPEEVKASLQKLCVFYGTKLVLQDIDLDIYSKSVVALVGASGCGKTTLLRCFNRMNDFVPECHITGKLLIDAANIYSSNIDVVMLRAKVGMVFQKPNPFPKTIYDNVAYGPKLHGMNNGKGKLDEIVENSLRRAGLWEEVKDELKKSAMDLSGGQQQRLCIARAIAVEPTMLLMDEPCSALDPKASKSIELLIHELKKRFTIIIVTHSMKQAQRVSDVTVYLNKGKIFEFGATEEIFNNPKTKEAKNYFLDSD